MSNIDIVLTEEQARGIIDIVGKDKNYSEMVKKISEAIENSKNYCNGCKHSVTILKLCHDGITKQEIIDCLAGKDMKCENKTCYNCII